MVKKKTLEGFLEATPFPKLAKKVFDQMGATFKEIKEYPEDYRDASSGVSGFIYYNETHEFSRKNRSLIIEMLEDSAGSLGVEVVSLVKSFGVFRNDEMDAEEMKDLYKFLGGGRPEQGRVTNIMAWFALEETINSLIDYLED